MPQSLRKACHACTQAKRRCVPQLPSCERCAKKQILCVYDLEPVTNETGLIPRARTVSDSGLISPTNIPAQSEKNGEFRIIYGSVGAARDASIAAVRNGEGFDSGAARPMLMADDGCADWLIRFFTQVAQNGIEGKATPFIHPMVLREATAISSPSSPYSYRSLSSDLSSPKTSLTYHSSLNDRLIEIHNLIILALQHLLIEKPKNKQLDEVENIIVRMFSSTRSMWQSSYDHLQSIVPGWLAWTTAESIRRSMFAAVMIRGLWYATANGYCYYEPFFESLPFDPRAGVWEAASQEEWIHAVNNRGGGHTSLKSYNEFITMSDKYLSSEEDGEFQRMLFVAYHGANGIRALEELDKAKYLGRSSSDFQSPRINR